MTGAPLTPPVPGGSGAPALRFGIGDAIIAWVAGIVGGVLAVVLTGIGLGLERAELDDNTAVFAALVLGQFGATFLAIALTSRFKGRGSLRLDFGLVVRPQDWSWVLRGVGLQVLAGIALLPISVLSDERQSVVEDINSAGGARVVLLALTALVLAPVVEELLFRGVLLRVLARRMPPVQAIWVSALAFAVAHPLLDPSAIVVVPGLMVLGTISALVALRSGTLSRSILLHVGFNLLAVVVALSS